MCIRDRYESIDKKEDFTFETVLSSEYKLNILRKAKEEGYFIKCVFVLTLSLIHILYYTSGLFVLGCFFENCDIIII